MLSRISSVFHSKTAVKIAQKIFGLHVACISICAPILLLVYWCIAFYVNPSLFLQPPLANPCHDISLQELQAQNLTCQNPDILERRSLLTRLYLKHLPTYILGVGIVLFIGYFAFGAFIHNEFYVKRRKTPHEWKIQPEKFMTPELELEGISEVCVGFVVVTLLTGTLFCYIMNEGPFSKAYFSLQGSSTWWTLLQVPVLLFWQDHTDYWRHRILHMPWFFKRIHKIHHKYKQPTAFLTFAAHPLEIAHFFAIPMVAIFVVPIYFGGVVICYVYILGHSLLEHSGVAFKAPWWMPWMPDPVFHDKHHSRGNVNFGLNTWFWDTLFGTSEQIRS